MHELIAWGLDEYPYRDAAMSDRREEFAKQIDTCPTEIGCARAPYELPCLARRRN